MRFKDTDYGDLTGQHYDGDIDVSNRGLTSLEGAPESIDGGFICSHNKLESLKGAPESVGVDFSCSNNKLESLEGAPKKVEGNFYCYMNSHPYLEKEWEIRKENPDLSEDEINEIMYEKTGYDIYLDDDIKNVFLF